MKDIKRGYVPGDEREFAGESLEKLKKAAGHIIYLVNEGYGIKSASVFAGNHFLLSERQRLALVRSISGNEQLKRRQKKQYRGEALKGQTVHIDGFNTIITLETALSGSLLLQCMDTTIRDLAGLRGTYRLINATSRAVEITAEVLLGLNVKKAVFYLDAPVSNSGRLKCLIADIWEKTNMREKYGLELDIRVIHDVDRVLMKLDHVITADAIILDSCAGWFNLMELCMEKIGAEPVKVW